MKEEGEIYSHSRLWLYENCPEYFKIKYLDNALPDLPVSMALFLGGLVHESLEWLYHQIKNREIGIDELIEDYSDRWNSQCSEKIRIPWGTPEEHFNRGVKFLVDYYVKNKPFKENTVAIERRVLFPLDSAGKYKIQGFIDRIVLNDDGVYEVHDYKTNQFMKCKEELDKDRQLGFYHLGLKEIFGEDVKVKLYWHFLSFNQMVSSERTDEQLEKLKSETLNLIKKIKSETIWQSCGKKFCDWCEYKRKNSTTYEEVLSLKNN